MSLFGNRPSGAPGGLSINTSSANTFGSSTSQPPAAGQAAPAGGLFGSTSTTAPKAGGLFGNATATPAAQTQSAPSLFGSTATATSTSQPQQPSSLFGSSLNQQPAQAQTGGLFGGGAPQTQSQTPAQGTSLFGAAPQAQPQTQSTGGGLFGNANATAQTNTGTSGPFGGLNTAAQPTNNALGGGFLGQSTQPKPSMLGGFGQQAQPQASTFGQKPSVGMGGGLGFGLTMGQSNAQQTVPGVRIDASNVKGTTRFNDLQEDLQKQIEQMDAFIVAQMQKKKEVDGFMSGHQDMLETIPNDVQLVTRKYDGARNALESAAQSIEAARLLVNQDADHARLSFRAVDNLKLPQQYHTTGFWSPRQPASSNANAESDGQDLVGFFSQTADEMAEQMRRYEGNLTEIENHMHGVSDTLVDQLTRMMATKNGASSGPEEKIQELVAVLRDFEQGILRVAGDVGSVKEGLTQLQLGDFIEP